MGYIRKTYKLGQYREVVEYHNGRYGGPGQKRQQRHKLTSEQQAQKNQHTKMVNCRRKLRAHFTENDYFTTLTYRPEERPADMEEAKGHFRKFVRMIRRAYRQAGAALKWICNIERGSRGAWHIHIVLNRIPGLDVILAKAWPYGRIQTQLLYAEGAFEQLARYITKQPETDSRLAESSYSSSRNLPIPEPDVRIFRKAGTWKAIRVPKGWLLEKSSVVESINPFTGYPYRSYTLRRQE